MPTIVVDNFDGRLNRYLNGDINSGKSKYTVTYGVDYFSKPGNITWAETPVQIDPSGSVITDLVVAGKERVESGISYVYCVGHTGRVYKIQVNDPTTYNPNYDNPVLLATISSGSPTFTRGGFIDFYGTTERIYIGHDTGVTRLDFDGTNETVVGSADSWTQTVPRPLKQFIGKLYVGNGSNIAEIDSTATVTSYAKLSPGFPSNTQVRDLDTSNDGNYLHMVVTRLALGSIISTTPDSGSISNSDSWIFKWNGIDIGYTSFDLYSAYSLTANFIFGSYGYVFGYDVTGSGLFSGNEKIISPVLTNAPMPNAMGTGANLIGWAATETYNATTNTVAPLGVLRMSQFVYGRTDSEVPVGWYRQLSMVATSPETDIIGVPLGLLVSNFSIGSSSNGYSAGIFGFGKYYFSTLETSSAPTTKYRFYKWFPVSTGLGTTMVGAYETQTQLFSEKIAIKEVRTYIEPLIASNQFKIEFTGSDGAVIPNSSQTFTAGVGPDAVGNDIVRYAPDMNQTYALGLRISNLGTTNWTCKKVEIDYEVVKS